MNDELSLSSSAFSGATFLGASLPHLAVAALATLLTYMAMTLSVRYALGRFAAGDGRTGAGRVLFEVLGGTNRWLIALVALLIGLGMLNLPEPWAGRVGQLWFVALALQIALWANRLVSILLRRYAEHHGAANGTQVSAAATLMSWGVRTLLWSIVLLAMLSNLGVNITAFIASLGVGGIAVALAAQNILGDLFASVAITVDKPFEVGDFIVIDSVVGTVETVGIKTTRIRSLGGEQIVMSNTEMLRQTIRNYKRLSERRIVFNFGVTYDSTADQVAQVPQIVRGIVEASEKLRFDRAHFKGFGENSLEFEVVYYVLDPGYGVYMDEQQRINLALMQSLEAIGVRFGLPVRTLRMLAPMGAAPSAAAA